MAVAAIIRPAIRRRGWRPAAAAAAVTRPYIRAASAPDRTGSDSLSARCGAAVRRARSSCSPDRCCPLSGRTWRPGGQPGAADRADRRLVREFGGADPAAQDRDGGVGQALPG
jgi:hypothetical protein